ncbi:MAG: hypothetical protein OHK0023_27290 [Anaerolineae bacterium]
MKIVGMYSMKQGREIITADYVAQFEQIQTIIASVDGEEHRTKISQEKMMSGRVLYNPRSLNQAFKQHFSAFGWHNHKVPCEYPSEYYVAGYTPNLNTRGGYREMDFVKDNIGVEVQFGKYAFMVYNVCAKMTISNRLGVIKVGVEIVPIKEFADAMSTGVSYFEQFVWDLQHRGESDIDIPVLVLGITA